MKTECRSVDRLERELIDLEGLKSRVTARQLELLRELEDVAQVAGLDGAKTLGEWTTRTLDVSAREGKALVRLARSIDPRLGADLTAGEVSTRRAMAETALATAGASKELIARSRGFDIAGVGRLVSQLKSFTAADEVAAFASRRLVLQPNLDESVWKYWGHTTGVSGRAMANALDQRADHLHQGIDDRPARPQRMADALDSIIQDSLTGTNTTQPSQDPLVTVFVDATSPTAAAAAADGGTRPEDNNSETVLEPTAPTAWVNGGVRVGPHTLEKLLCLGAVEVIGVDDAFNPIAATPAHRTIPPKLRRAILARDGGCVIDGCDSTYRLQPHHIIPASHGGHTTPDNLATLCWYHHHIVIHGQGRQLDPDSPPQRRRFLRPQQPGPDPPT